MNKVRFVILCPVLALGPLVLSVVDISLSSAWARNYDHTCAVFKGKRLKEKAPCTRREFGNRVYDSLAGVYTSPRKVLYTWKTGGKTLLANIELAYSINDKEGKYISAHDTGYDICVKNLSSGNTFCARADAGNSGTSVSDVSDDGGEEQWKIHKDKTLNGTCTYKHPNRPAWNYKAPCRYTSYTRMSAFVTVTTQAHVSNGKRFTFETVSEHGRPDRHSINGLAAIQLKDGKGMCMHAIQGQDMACIYPR